jgi:histidinol-phosphatase (PHP family)
MRILSDCHMHSSYSGDSRTPMEDQIRSAREHGLAAVCFTEHYDMDFPYAENPGFTPDEYGMFELDMQQYRSEFLSQKRILEHPASDHPENPALSSLRLFFGVELGLQPGLNERYSRFLAENSDLDFVIGSVHLSNQSDPYSPLFFKNRPEEECYREYFTYSLECLKSCDCFDSYGHLDYVVRYGPTKDRNYRYEQYRDLIDPMLELLISRGKALELNTAPFGKGCLQQNPCEDILKRYRALGGEMVTVGSDAHVPENIALAFDRAAAVLENCGFRYYTTFENRKPVMQRL